MDSTILVAAPLIASLIAGLVGLGLSIWFEVELRREGRERASPETTAERVRRLTQALNESADTVEEIEQEIRERHRLAESLKRDVEMNKHLRNMEQEQVEAVVQALDIPIQRAGRRSLLYNFLFFLAGAIVTTLISWLLA